MSAHQTETPTLNCSYCGKSQHKVAKLFKSQAACICEECVWLCLFCIVDPQRWSDRLYDEVIAFMRAWPESARTAAGDTEERSAPARREGLGDVDRGEPEAQEGQMSTGWTGTETFYCSFCGTSQYEAQLLAGPTVFICDDCVWTCMEVLADLPEDMPAEIYDDVVAFMRGGGLGD